MLLKTSVLSVQVLFRLQKAKLDSSSVRETASESSSLRLPFLRSPGSLISQGLNVFLQCPFPWGPSVNYPSRGMWTGCSHLRPGEATCRPVRWIQALGKHLLIDPRVKDLLGHFQTLGILLALGWSPLRTHYSSPHRQTLGTAGLVTLPVRQH